MSYSVETASQILRQSMRETIQKYSFWYLLQGCLMVVAGIFAILFPALSSFAMVRFLGWLLIGTGIVQAFGVIGSRSAPNFLLQLISGALFVMVGLMFLRSPVESMLTLSLLLIVLFMVEGISKIVFALTIRPLPNWIWVLFSGIVGVMLSLYLWSRMPVTGIWLIGTLLGISLISEGFAIALLAWQIRKRRSEKADPNTADLPV
ncbi:HdeD family acid-resistance protein [Paracoccus aminophilus]|uniref:HdeD family acid-resistance protein n=1 Tax=Paracoccus aminophilus JCM 7686 TaxID=1367847 RepID=S5YVU6_PARAH|nr:HdeD family acid-resistance protein [Paracoccus aminophilus]AGT09371.1 hypothetical protein JCM7686_2301 [Paracoccus aminophilus JCM 7686]